MKRWRIIPSFRFINFHKEYPPARYPGCWTKWFSVSRYWYGRLVYFQVKHYSLQLDFRKNWQADMIDGGTNER